MEDIYKTIQFSEGRLTKIKKGIIGILFESRCLLSRTDLVAKLKAKKINPSRSTIYRELQFLTKNNIVAKSNISGTDYYEIPQDHHHHLVCLECHKISKIEMDNHLKKQEKQIAKQNKFKVTNHSVEFYGYCHKCQV